MSKMQIALEAETLRRAADSGDAASSRAKTILTPGKTLVNSDHVPAENLDVALVPPTPAGCGMVLGGAPKGRGCR